MKVAIYKNTEFEFETVCTKDSERYMTPAYTRVSEYVDIDPQRLTDAEMAANEIVALKKQREVAMESSSQELDGINSRIEKLLKIKSRE